GREVTKHHNFSEETGKLIDDEVKRIISIAEKRAGDILSTNIDKLHALSNVLLEREILDSEEIDKVLRGEQLPALVKNGNGTAIPAPDPVIEQAAAIIAQQETNGKTDAKPKPRSRTRKS
ncbi:MAG: hypothetical protein WCX28_14685, partial [Bacteriovoracaceae bacterium]